ncbi:hypothetical protein VVMO6_01339 [Vibrio vulnificus MO6-24/O]|nr:hypothetical protein VVMO6_01339 [Vibrio vulnificus MO6-24/O]
MLSFKVRASVFVSHVETKCNFNQFYELNQFLGCGFGV